MENMYVLSRKDPFFGDVLFYVECKSDTTNITMAEEAIFSRIRHSVLGTVYPLMQKSGMLLVACMEML